MIYNPEQWSDFFVMVGGGAAALSGLVFVAMSLTLESIIGDDTHRNRAIGTLAGRLKITIRRLRRLHRLKESTDKMLAC